MDYVQKRLPYFLSCVFMTSDEFESLKSSVSRRKEVREVC